MAYIGNAPATGENNSFRILDDITTYTLTFDGSSSSVVSTSDNTISYINHRFITGQRVTYNDGGGTAIGGLSDGVYYIIKYDQNSIKLASSYANAIGDSPISLTGLGVGSSHTLNVAFDGVNTKFKATYNNGTRAQMTRAAQLMLSVNGVIQEPQDTASPTAGFGIDGDSVIVFSTAPSVSDTFWGNIIANNFPTFDISDNTVDNFTGDNSTVSFTLSKPPANNQNVLVTLDGVVQYPSDNNTVRAYSVSDQDIEFTSAPGLGVDIQVRHIGFAGATSSNVTGFYGRTGNAALRATDNIVVGNVNSSGIITASGGFNIGIQSAGVNVTTGVVTALNFVGAGNTFAVNGTTVDISIAGGGGGGGLANPVNDTDGIFNYVSTAATVTSSITLDASNSGSSSSFVLVSEQQLHVDSGVTVTVGSGKKLVIDILELPN